MSESTAVATLPTTADHTKWSPDQRALVEAAGLVHMTPQGEKVYAEMPTVAAFLAHCNKTGLDPIAKQIYCLPRKSKGTWRWTIQISIDGARLVAERSGLYEGQTTPEFTGDGKEWTQVWLEKEYPKAARVGVFRRGFKEPLYAVALWDAYVQTRDEWVDNKKTGNVIVSEMWHKMGPLMLAKCAEMLALRKAFPQDLSGLYSAEEMSQVVEGEQLDEGSQEAAPLVEAAVVEPEPVWPAEKVDEFLLAVQASASVDALGVLFGEAKVAGALDMKVDAQGTTIENLIWQRRHDIENPRPAASVPAPEEEVSSDPTDYDDDDPRAKVAEANRRAEQAGPESVPMVLDVEGGAS